jgi:hypothetical protein
MNKFIIIVFITAYITFLKTNSVDEEVLWGERSIEWVDFKGSPPIGYNTMDRAYTTTSIDVKYSQVQGKVPKTKVRCYFLINESWTLVNDDYALGHERLHFDIAEIHARKIRKAFEALNDENVKDISKYHDVVDFYGKEQEKYNYKYDSAVYFNKERQALWSKKIKDELIELEEYQYLPSNE